MTYNKPKPAIRNLKYLRNHVWKKRRKTGILHHSPRGHSFSEATTHFLPCVFTPLFPLIRRSPQPW